MTPELKKYWWGIVFTPLGSVIVLMQLVQARITARPPAVMPADMMSAANWFLVGLGVLMILGGGIMTFIYDTEAGYARKWKKLALGSYDDFPRTKVERQALRNTWARGTLEKAAMEATEKFELRDAAKLAHTTFSTSFPVELADPSHLAKARKEFEAQEEKSIALACSYNGAIVTAQLREDTYLALWDLFKGMDMLPRQGTWTLSPHSTGNNPWYDPNEFRKSLMAKPEQPGNPGDDSSAAEPPKAQLENASNKAPASEIANMRILHGVGGHGMVISR